MIRLTHEHEILNAIIGLIAGRAMMHILIGAAADRRKTPKYRD